jgi:hypothetical protein
LNASGNRAVFLAGLFADVYTASLVLRYLILTFWTAVGLAGILLVYAALSYETEDGKIQSVLEDWWLRIDDFRQQAISSHIAFMKVLASVMTRFMNKLFGARMFSLQSIGVAACYSVVWIGLALLMLSRLNPSSKSNPFDSLRLVLFGLVYGSFPAFFERFIWRSLRFVHVWFAGLIFIFVSNLIEPFGYLMLVSIATPGLRIVAALVIAIVVGIAFSIFLFTLFISIMRLTLRTIARINSPIKIVGLSLLNAAPLFTFYGLFKLIVWWPDPPGKVAEIGLMVLLVLIICGILFNFAFFLSAVLFVCLAATMLLHRLFWPAIGRPLYKLQALEVSLNVLKSLQLLV